MGSTCSIRRRAHAEETKDTNATHDDYQRLRDVANDVSHRVVEEADASRPPRRRDSDELQRAHETLARDPMWTCDGQLARDAVREGHDAFVLWHLSHCNALASRELVSLVVACGRVNIVAHLLTHGLTKADDLIRLAVAQGSMQVIHWLHEALDADWTTMAMDEAARHGRLHVVQWLHTHRSEGCSTWAMTFAAMHGHLEVVQWLHVHRTEGCTSRAMDWAAQAGHLHVVQWLHANRTEGGSIDAMNLAADNGHLAVVQWLHAHRTEGCSEQAMAWAAASGHLSVVQWLHANRSEGCGTAAMDGAAREGHLDVIQWLHANRTEGCTTDAMEGAARNGHVNVVRWLLMHRRVDCPSSPMNAIIALRDLSLVSETYDGEEVLLWPRPGHASILAALARSSLATDQAILKLITTRRHAQYRQDAAENPEEFMAIEDAPAEDAVHHTQLCVLTAVVVLCETRNFPSDVGQHISDFILPQPSKKFTPEEAAQRGLMHWLLLFSTHPNEAMTRLAEIGYVEQACQMHDRLARDNCVQCTTRFLYLTMVNGHLDLVKWHVLNCVTHGVDMWLYAATWVGRVDVVEWMCGQWHGMSSHRPRGNEETLVPYRKTLFHSIKASFTDVEERFGVDLVEVEAAMTDTEKAVRRGNSLRFVHSFETSKVTTNLADLAAIYGHADILELLQHRHSVHCTVSGLYGAISRGHFGVVQRIYEKQQGLAVWPTQNDGSLVLRRLLTPSSQELRRILLHSRNPRQEEESLYWLLKFYRSKQNMRLDGSSLNEAALHGDLSRVQLICQFDLVENKTEAADIAAARGDLKMLQSLFAVIATGARCSTQALDAAAEGGYLDVVQYLHQHNAPCTRRAVDLSASNGHLDVVQFLLQHRQEGCSSYALYWASARGFTGVVKCLTSHLMPGDIDMCLRVAREQGHDSVVSVLEMYRRVYGETLRVTASSRHLVRRTRLHVDFAHAPQNTGEVLNQIRRTLRLPPYMGSE